MRSTSARSFSIVLKSEADSAFIRRLSEEVFSEYTRGAGAHTLRMAESELAVTFVAFAADGPVGFSVMSFEAPAATLLAIAVESRARGLGVGQRLLAACEAEARERGVKVLTLATAEANVAALDLFLRAGYRITGRLFRYYGRGQNAVGMKKRL